MTWQEVVHTVSWVPSHTEYRPMRHVARSADALSFAHTFVRFEWLAYRYDSTLTSSSLPACWDRSQVTSLSLQNTFALFSRQITLAVSEVRMPSSCGANYLKIDPHEFDDRRPRGDPGHRNLQTRSPKVNWS